MGVARCKNVGWTTMASAELELILGVWVKAHSGVQGQSPWSGGQGTKLPEAERFCYWNTQTRGKSCHVRVQLVSVPYTVFFLIGFG